MSNILVVTGSVRPNSVNQKIAPLVVDQLKAKGANPTIIDLGELNLPFFDAPIPPSSPDFEPTNEAAIKWTNLVDQADGVVLVTPEYNHTLTPIQLNAIDWIGKEWANKPIALVGYGWGTGGGQAHDAAREALAVNLNARVGEKQTNLFFTKDIDLDGSPLDAESVNQKISLSLDELLELVEA